jgi:Flp pilus assembly protein TadB
VISEGEQTLLLLVSAVTVLGTLVVIVWQLWRSRNRRDDD